MSPWSSYSSFNSSTLSPTPNCAASVSFSESDNLSQTVPKFFSVSLKSILPSSFLATSMPYCFNASVASLLVFCNLSNTSKILLTWSDVTSPSSPNLAIIAPKSVVVPPTIVITSTVSSITELKFCHFS